MKFVGNFRGEAIELGSGQSSMGGYYVATSCCHGLERSLLHQTTCCQWPWTSLRVISAVLNLFESVILNYV